MTEKKNSSANIEQQVQAPPPQQPSLPKEPELQYSTEDFRAPLPTLPPDGKTKKWEQ